MIEVPHPTDPQEYKEWVKELKRKWETGVIPDPQTVAIIITNDRNEVLLQLRDDNPQITFANHWTLPGGVVNPCENHEDAAYRELLEETGLRSSLSHWKMYKRNIDSGFVIEQHVYFGKTGKNVNEMVLGEGQALEFFGEEKLGSLLVGYDFDKLLDEYFDHFK